MEKCNCRSNFDNIYYTLAQIWKTPYLYWCFKRYCAKHNRTSNILSCRMSKILLIKLIHIKYVVCVFSMTSKRKKLKIYHSVEDVSSVKNAVN